MFWILKHNLPFQIFVLWYINTYATSLFHIPYKLLFVQGILICFTTKTSLEIQFLLCALLLGLTHFLSKTARVTNWNLILFDLKLCSVGKGIWFRNCKCTWRSIQVDWNLAITICSITIIVHTVLYAHVILDCQAHTHIMENLWSSTIKSALSNKFMFGIWTLNLPIYKRNLILLRSNPYTLSHPSLEGEVRYNNAW